ncbi:MAG TPA: sigma 54-interacting transcriptional regulator [Bryobacteraceae bacterium]|nr:sigma 54-interacting transcriptional regulator [Bryobacteraceae bacterium]
MSRMEPRLVAVRGPLKGAILLLPEGRYSVGRQAKNNLHLDDHAVSREHCIFTRSGQECTLKDLESRNGTLVNGTPITDCKLGQGDEIRIGSSVFCFLVASDRSLATQETDSKTRELRVEDAVYLSAAGDVSLPPSARALHDLRTLLRVSTILHSFRGLHDVHGAPAGEILRSHLSALLLELIPAERGAVMIPGLEFSGDWTPYPPAVKRISEERVALWLEDANGAGLSVLGAPLMVRGEVAALLYLESADPRRKFDEGHLQFLTAVAGMAAGAWENATILSWLQEENERLATELKLEHDMVGESTKLRELQRQIGKAAPVNSTVLILGESGTGKELVARAIHRNSLRAGGPFVAINCAALADTLLESELFGHEKGAFTGAIAAKKGKLELAEGGTVFLDEIGELSPLLQAKLLRVLQQREMEHVGGTKTIKLDIRVLAATNRDLDDAVKKGVFRQDLYYRLNVVVLRAPTLRERPEDILPLAEHFAKKYAQECGRKIIGLAPETRAYLQSYQWPGNVRELENALERAVVLGSADTVLPEDLPEQIRESRPAEVSASLYEEAVEAAKRQVVIRAFDQADYDHETAAKILGLHPNYLHKLIRTMDLKAVIKRAGR